MEVNRLCTDGTRNACSMLYAAAWRAARAMGYKRIVTYILESENGASLRLEMRGTSWGSALDWETPTGSGPLPCANENQI